MALQYFFNEDEYAGPSQGLDDAGEHFWAGVFRAAAPLALAATVAAAALSTQIAAAQAAPADEVFTSLTPDEDYAPTVLQIPLWHSAWYAGTAAPPAPVPEEDAWQPWLVAPPNAGALYLVAPWAWGSAADDLAIVGNTVAPTDEDYWQNGVLPVAATLAWPAPASFEQHDLAPPGQPEEAFWSNAVPPAPWSYAPLWPWALDPQDALSVPGTPDEDFWTSGVAPATYALRALSVWASDPLDEQAAFLVAPVPTISLFEWVRPFGVAPFAVQVHPVRLFPEVNIVNAAVAFVPTQLAGLAAWYDASQLSGLADGDPVGTWPDLSGNGNDATQGTAAARPTYKVSIQNGLPVIRPDDVDDLLRVSLALPQPFTIAWVGAPHLTNSALKATFFAFTAGGQTIIETNNGVSPRAWYTYAGAFLPSNTLLATGTFHTFITIVNNTSSVADTDGTDIVSGTVGTNAPTAFAIGGPSAGNDGWDMAEIAIYSRALTSTERLQLEAYLKAKWGTP